METVFIVASSAYYESTGEIYLGASAHRTYAAAMEAMRKDIENEIAEHELDEETPYELRLNETEAQLAWGGHSFDWVIVEENV